MASRKIRVLIADDNREISELLRAYVHDQADMESVGIVYNGLEVLDIIAEAAPDVLLVDLIMPHLDGLGVLEELNRMDHLPFRPKIIVLSVFGQENLTQQVLDLGADYYILKPFSLDVLGTRIRQIVGPAPQAPPLGSAHPSSNSYISFRSKNLENDVTVILHEIWIPVKIKGFRYLRDGIQMVISDVGLLSSVTKELYPRIARDHQSTPSRVERAIRHAIEKVWANGNAAVINELFGPGANLRGKPTNSEFIAVIADRLRREGTS